jgi:hypothetical protein
MTLRSFGDVSQILFDGIQTKAEVNPAKVKSVGDTAYARILAAFARKKVGLARTYYEEFDMLWTIFVILLVLWLLGIVSSYTLGGYIHILLLVAIVVVLIRVIQGRNPVP